MTFARDKANQVQSAFRSVGIDDNADTLAITIDSSEKVGIGETSPLGILHIKTADSGASANANADELVIEGSGSGVGVGANILSATDGFGYVAFGDSGGNAMGGLIYHHNGNSMRFSTNDAERVRIASDGKVGIGTSSPLNQLHVRSSGNGIVRFDGNANTNTSTLLVSHNTSGDCGLQFNSNQLNMFSYGDIAFFPSTSNISGSYPNGQTVVFKNSGKVGIGTSSPSHPLHIVSSGNGELKVERTSGTQILLQSQSALGKIGTATNHNLQFFVNNTGYMTLTTAGRLAVGNTSPKAALHVTGSNGILVESENTNGDGQIYFGDTTGTDRLYLSRSLNDFAIWNVSNGIIKLATNNAERMRITSDGRLGIGTATLDANAQVQIEGAEEYLVMKHTGQMGIKLYGDDTNIIYSYDKSGNSLTGGITWNHADGTTLFYTGGSNERMRIASNGEVRVGTSNDYSASLTSYTGTTDHKSFNAEANNASYGSDVLNIACTRNTNNTSYRFLTMERRGYVQVFRVTDAGDVDNYNNSYGSLSDERIKKDITESGSQWDDIKAIKVKKFKMALGGDEKPKIGVIAQEVEEAGMNGLVKERDANKYEIKHNSVFGTLWSEEDDEVKNGTKTAGEIKENKEKVKEVRYSILYMKAIKALQEAMDRIETLEAKVTALEN